MKGVFVPNIDGVNNNRFLKLTATETSDKSSDVSTSDVGSSGSIFKEKEYLPQYKTSIYYFPETTHYEESEFLVKDDGEAPDVDKIGAEEATYAAAENAVDEVLEEQSSNPLMMDSKYESSVSWLVQDEISDEELAKTMPYTSIDSSFDKEFQSQKNTVSKVQERLNWNTQFMASQVQNSTGFSDEEKLTFQTNSDNLMSVSSSLNDVKFSINQATMQSFAITNEMTEIESALASLENLSAEKGDSLYDSVVEYRESLIQSYIVKQAQANVMQKNIEQLKTQEDEYSAQKTAIESEREDLITSFSEKNPDFKKIADAMSSTIKNTQAEYDGNISYFDKFEQRRMSEIAQYAAFNGDFAAKNFEYGPKIVETAEKYLGYNEKDGSYHKFTGGRDYAWCSSFVTYVTKKAFNKLGIEVPKEFGSSTVHNVQNWGIKNNCYMSTCENNSQENRAQRAEQLSTLRAGDIVIFRENGAGHIGIVDYYDAENDTVHTIEGNVSDEVAEREYSSDYQDKISGYVQLWQYRKTPENQQK